MSDLIPPGVRSRLRRLRLIARRAVGQQGIGAHRSRSRGSGLEFAQYRAYEQGDEPRQIDWKLYARSDKFFVREAERESPLTLWVLIDLSASMGQADAVRPGFARLDAARSLTACLAELAIAQGDRFGLIALHADGLRMIAPGTGARHRDRLFIELHRLTVGGDFPAPEQLAALWERIGAHDLVMMLSDFFDEAAVALVERLAAARRETLAIQLLTAEERDFPFDDGRRFRDPETGEELLGDGRAMRDDFIARFAAARAALDARFDAAGIRHAVQMLDEAPDVSLQRLFGGRR